jgi:hypothetical protein
MKFLWKKNLGRKVLVYKQKLTSLRKECKLILRNCMFKESFESLIINLQYVKFFYSANDNEEMHEKVFQVMC